MSLEESELQELVAQSKESEKKNYSDSLVQMKAQRNEDERKWTESMVKHPRVGLLPSPELLTEGSKRGQDAAGTIKDFRQTLLWLKKKGALNTGFYEYDTSEEALKKEQFGALIKLAFSNSFAAMRHTANPTLDEYVIWYYTGHGRPISENTKITSMPKLKKVEFDITYNDSAKDFAKHLQDQPVKGGELCLHHVGYCGLYGLIKPWIASVKGNSQNSSEEKKNKHLIIILDSCYAGMIAKDLEELNKEQGPWNQNGCSITIQTACGHDEPTFGRYFTPSFVTLNDEQSTLDDLKEKWAKMKDEDKDRFCSLPLPSPKVVTTRDDSGQKSPTMEFSFKNGQKLTLFSNPGFFKFCSLSIFEKDELKEEDKLRVLSENAARDFMGNASNFTVLDYKLKTLQGDEPFAGSPLGLFLIEIPGNPKFAVLAHVHFAKEDTSRVGRINLVHHLKPQGNGILYVEDHKGLSKNQVKEGKHEIKYADVSKVEEASKPEEYWEWNKGDPSSSISFKDQSVDEQSILKDQVNKGAKLVKACHDLVEKEEPGRWRDHTKWNMKSSDPSHSHKFKKEERLQWMDDYMARYEN